MNSKNEVIIYFSAEDKSCKLLSTGRSHFFFFFADSRVAKKIPNKPHAVRGPPVWHTWLKEQENPFIIPSCYTQFFGCVAQILFCILTSPLQCFVCIHVSRNCRDFVHPSSSYPKQKTDGHQRLCSDLPLCCTRKPTLKIWILIKQIQMTSVSSLRNYNNSPC
jgi:hypothetical protein